MRVEYIESQLTSLTATLIKLVEENCWNEISPNYSYIISEIKINSDNYDFYEDLRKRRQESKLKIPKNINEICKDLVLLYDNIYDLNLYVHQSKKNETIIDIRYYPKSSLNLEFLETVRNNAPMLHAKIAHPIYQKSKTDKFDVNWELEEWRFQWNFFVYRLKLKLMK